MDTTNIVGMGFDIETGPQAADVLKEKYTVPTLDEFTKSKGKVNWKPETFSKNYHEQFLPTHYDEFVSKAALRPLFGRVMMIGFGFKMVDGDTVKNKVIPSSHISDEVSEEDLIQGFWDSLCRAKELGIPITGFNIKHFDLPFLVRRSWILSVPVPSWVCTQGPKYVNYDSSFVDLAVNWAFGTGEFIKFNDLSISLGYGAKLDDGARFFEIFLEDFEAAKSYNEDEIDKILKIASRLNVF